MTLLRFAWLLLWITPGLLLAQAPQPQPPQPQFPQPKQPVPAPMPVDPNAVAATVNGAAIYEVAVQRNLEGIPPARRAEARAECLNFLIDNLVLDQYLTKANVHPTAQEVEGRFNEMKEALAKKKIDLIEMLRNFRLSEAELRLHIASDLRWEKYASSQATDAALKQLFDSSKEMFDETSVRARHILLTPAEEPKTIEVAVATLRAIKQEAETKAAQAVATVPDTADPLTREKTRVQAMEESFAARAKERSTCPTKERGGDVGFFERLRPMVEPFSKAAFALKPYEMSDVVKTPFGYHLILVLERKPGKDVPFDQVKEIVRTVFQERLRENLLAQLKPKAQIAVAQVR